MTGQCKATSVLWKCVRELSVATETMETGTEREAPEVDSAAVVVDMVTVTGKVEASEERGVKEVMSGGLIPETNHSEEERIEACKST